MPRIGPGGGLRGSWGALVLLPLLAAAAACSGSDEAEPSVVTSARPEPAPPSLTETVEMRETDPAAWRIRAKTECNSMTVFYEAIFREGKPKRLEIAGESAQVLRDWHAQMFELGALEADEALFQEAMGLYEEGIAGLEAERYATVQKLTGEEFRPLYEGTSAAVRPRVNRVRGECRGGGKRPTRVRFFVNGRLTQAITDRDGHDRYTDVGLAVFSPEGGLEVLFDDVVATALRAPRGR